MLATLDDLKDQLGIDDTENDVVLTKLVTWISARFERDSKRLLVREAGRTKVFDGGANCLHLDLYPVETVTSVKEAIECDFTDADALVENSDYFVREEAGLIYRAGDARWLSGRKTVQVIWTGGYVDPADDLPTPAEGETQTAVYVPEDLQGAIIDQCIFRWKHKDDLGLTSVGVAGQSWAVSGKEPWLTEVQNVLDHYTRKGF